MKTIIAFAMFLSLNAVAAPDFSALNLGSEFAITAPDSDRGDKMKCVHGAWKAAEPTDSQNAAAKAELQRVKDIFESRKSDLRQAFRQVMAAWKKHPVVMAEVAAAEDGVKDLLIPVMEAGREARVNVINLLSLEQRRAFDRKLMDCLKEGR